MLHNMLRLASSTGTVFLPVPTNAERAQDKVVRKEKIKRWRVVVEGEGWMWVKSHGVSIVPLPGLSILISLVIDNQ